MVKGFCFEGQWNGLSDCRFGDTHWKLLCGCWRKGCSSQSSGNEWICHCLVFIVCLSHPHIWAIWNPFPSTGISSLAKDVLFFFVLKETAFHEGNNFSAIPQYLQLLFYLSFFKDTVVLQSSKTETEKVWNTKWQWWSSAYVGVRTNKPMLFEIIVWTILYDTVPKAHSCASCPVTLQLPPLTRIWCQLHNIKLFPDTS